MRAAGLALPHEVPKLSVAAVISKQDYAALLDARIERAKLTGELPRDYPKVIEHQPTEPMRRRGPLLSRPALLIGKLLLIEAKHK
jgi:hypothetical protein